MAITPLARVEITPNTPSSWQDVDVSSYVPTGTTGVLLHVENTHATSNYSFGLRKNGSTDARTQSVYANSQAWFAVGVDGNSLLELYVANTTDLNVYLIAYCDSDVVFFTNAIDKTPSTTGTWVDVNISSDTGSDTAIAAIFEVISTSSTDTDNNVGLRKKGSSNAYSDYVSRHTGAIVGVDGSEILQAYRNIGAQIFLVGYIKAGVVMATNATNATPSTTGVYEDLPALPSAGTMGIYEINSLGASDTFALRKKGESLDIYRRVRLHGWAFVSCDENNLVEGKVSRINTYKYTFAQIGYVLSTGTNLSLDENGQGSENILIETSLALVEEGSSEENLFLNVDDVLSIQDEGTGEDIIIQITSESLDKAIEENAVLVDSVGVFKIALRGATTANNGVGATTLDVPKPSAIQKGDLLLAFVSCRGGTNVAITPPDGWTLLRRENNGTAMMQAVYYKIAEAGSPYIPTGDIFYVSKSGNNTDGLSEKGWNYCRHPDGFQIWDGGDQYNLTVERCVIGPGLMQGCLLGDGSSNGNSATVHNVTIKDSLVYGCHNHSWGDKKTDYNNYPTNWRIENCTMDRLVDENWHNVNFSGSASNLTIINSIFTGGKYMTIPSGGNYSGNIYWRVTPNPGVVGVNADPQYNDPNVYGSNNLNADYTLSPSSPYVGKGSPITSGAQLLALTEETGEPDSYLFSLSPAQPGVAVVVAYSGVYSADPVQTSGAQMSSGSSTITAPSLNTYDNVMLLGAFGIATTTSISTDVRLTERGEDVASGGLTLAVGDEAWPVAGATGVREGTTPLSAPNIGHLLALRQTLGQSNIVPDTGTGSDLFAVESVFFSLTESLASFEALAVVGALFLNEANAQSVETLTVEGEQAPPTNILVFETAQAGENLSCQSLFFIEDEGQKQESLQVMALLLLADSFWASEALALNVQPSVLVEEMGASESLVLVKAFIVNDLGSADEILSLQITDLLVDLNLGEAGLGLDDFLLLKELDLFVGDNALGRDEVASPSATLVVAETTTVGDGLFLATQVIDDKTILDEGLSLDGFGPLWRRRFGRYRLDTFQFTPYKTTANTNRSR